ncbi:MAG: tol-pal system protein YbgF [Inquilinus sp.]|nr:tol-pal system protein YbgF [Inquilinus sp.]
MSGTVRFPRNRRSAAIFGRSARRRAGGVAVLALAATLFAPTAWAQRTDVESLINRVIRLEREMQTLNLQVYRGEQPSPSASGAAGVAPAPLPDDYAAQFEIRLSQIERQLREITGRVEESQFHVRQMSERLDRAIADIEFRLSLLDGAPPSADGTSLSPAASATAGAAGAATGAPGALGAPSVPSGTAAPAPAARSATASAATGGVRLPAGDVATQYDYAYGLLAQGDYDNAERALLLFADAHPDHQLTSNAYYWLGETYYVRGSYDDAAISFAQGYQSFPEGAKAVDSLLKLGMALAAGGNREDACLTLNQLEIEFPDAPTGVKRRAAQERNRLDCTS